MNMEYWWNDDDGWETELLLQRKQHGLALLETVTEM